MPANYYEKYRERLQTIPAPGGSSDGGTASTNSNRNGRDRHREPTNREPHPGFPSNIKLGQLMTAGGGHVNGKEKK